MTWSRLPSAARRGGNQITEVDLPIASGNSTGVVIHYQDPENFMAAVITDAGGGGNNATPKLVRRKDGDYSVIATGTAFAMTSGQTMSCVITTSGGVNGPQTLTVCVNGTSRLTSTAIDDDWAAGHVGLIAPSGSGSQLDFDNFKVGFDNNGDADIADLGDDIKLSDGFGSTKGCVWRQQTAGSPAVVAAWLCVIVVVVLGRRSRRCKGR